MASPDQIAKLLPPSLLLPPHLSAHKYFFVCTLTVAAWDTLVLSPRTWRLMKTKEWPPLKVIYHLLRYLMPIEFTIVAVAFFDTKWSFHMCQRFYLFEPIVTMCLVSLCSVVALIRLHAIFDHSKAVLGGLSVLLLVQVGTMAACCAFYRPMPLKEGQGCIAGPVANWVGIYWLAPTLFWTVAFGLALTRSIQSVRVKPLGAWKLMLRDGLNLYGTERHHTVSGGGAQTKSIGGVGTGRQTYTLDEMRGQTEWQDDALSHMSGLDVKGGEIGEYGGAEDKSRALASEDDVSGATGVKVKVDQEVDYRRDM
ncbi:hypothetical protein FRC06_000115 [Ceratobasidium sp. 370]|nr:hypothetical protein FRC06_000115 [Ceratobasidium sp. 370]